MVSTLHECLKYYRDREKKINGDVKPLTRVEPYFAHARFFKECVAPQETMALTISFTGKRWIK